MRTFAAYLPHPYLTTTCLVYVKMLASSLGMADSASGTMSRNMTWKLQSR